MTAVTAIVATAAAVNNNGDDDRNNNNNNSRQIPKRPRVSCRRGAGDKVVAVPVAVAIAVEEDDGCVKRQERSIKENRKTKTFSTEEIAWNALMTQQVTEGGRRQDAAIARGIEASIDSTEEEE